MMQSIIIKEIKRMKELMGVEKKYEQPAKGKKMNQPCFDKNGNFLGWFSRSVATVAFIFCKNKQGKWCLLAGQRGKGTPDPEFVGAWNAICGYLDYYETLKDCVKKEIHQETGVDIDESILQFIKINDDPNSDKRQNITVHYFGIINDKTTDEFQFSHKDNEKDEVDGIKFIEVDKIDDYKWAFNHGNLAKSYYELYIKDK